METVSPEASVRQHFINASLHLVLDPCKRKRQTVRAAQGVLLGAPSGMGLHDPGQDFLTPQCQGLKQGQRKREIGNPDGTRLRLQISPGDGL